jgi:hypothetical protein
MNETNLNEGQWEDIQQSAASLFQYHFFVHSITTVGRTNLSAPTAVQISFSLEPHFFASFHFPI